MSKLKKRISAKYSPEPFEIQFRAQLYPFAAITYGITLLISGIIIARQGTFIVGASIIFEALLCAGTVILLLNYSYKTAAYTFIIFSLVTSIVSFLVSPFNSQASVIFGVMIIILLFLCILIISLTRKQVIIAVISADGLDRELKQLSED